MEKTSATGSLEETTVSEATDSLEESETISETPTDTEADTTKADEPKTYDQTYVNKLRREAQKKGAEVNSLKERVAALEAEKADEVEAIRQEYRLRASKDITLKALETAKVIDPDLAFGLIESRLEFNGDNLKNLDAVVKEFVTTHPKMVAVPLPDTQSTSPESSAAHKTVSGRVPGRL